MDLVLNQDLDTAALRETYRQNAGWVRVENLLPAALADHIEDVLKTKTPWRFTHSDASGEHRYYAPDEIRNMPADIRNRLITDTLSRAKTGFAYIYNVFPMVDLYLSGEEPAWPLHPMTEFLNSDVVQAFVKTITDEPTVVKLDAQATCYAPGHFLNTHDDTGNMAERRVAYVMGFTRDWNVNWGGQTLFTDARGNTLRGLSPTFNSLTLFKVPRPHLVTQVSTFAPRNRYSITGWLRSDL